jgi:hypothetical protein
MISPIWCSCEPFAMPFASTDLKPTCRTVAEKTIKNNCRLRMEICCRVQGALSKVCNFIQRTCSSPVFYSVQNWLLTMSHQLSPSAAMLSATVVYCAILATSAVTIDVRSGPDQPTAFLFLTATLFALPLIDNVQVLLQWSSVQAELPLHEAAITAGLLGSCQPPVRPICARWGRSSSAHMSIVGVLICRSNQHSYKALVQLFHMWQVHLTQP